MRPKNKFLKSCKIVQFVNVSHACVLLTCRCKVGVGVAHNIVHVEAQSKEVQGGCEPDKHLEGFINHPGLLAVAAYPC